MHTAIQLPFSLYIMRNSFEAVPRELEEAAVIGRRQSSQVLIRIFLPAVVPGDRHGGVVRVHHVVERVPGCAGDDEQGAAFTLPVILAAARTETSLRRHRLGHAPGGRDISIIPCVLFYLLLQRYYVSGLTSGAVK